MFFQLINDYKAFKAYNTRNSELFEFLKYLKGQCHENFFKLRPTVVRLGPF